MPEPQLIGPLSEYIEICSFVPSRYADKPIFLFKDVNTFFFMQCKYGDTKIEVNKGIVAIVLDAREIDPDLPPVIVEPYGSQTAFIRVASADGGFSVLAKSPAGRGEVLKPDDAVIWVPTGCSEKVAAVSPDKRFGWVELIRAKIKTEVGDIGSNWEIICQYP